ncbi:MAG: hypothetical protein SGARI_003686 [Bacillariaceae sp.]
MPVDNVQLITDPHYGFSSGQSPPCPYSIHGRSVSSHASSMDDRWGNTSSCERDVALSSPLSSRLRWKSHGDNVMDVISWASTSVPPEKPRRSRDVSGY